MKFSRAGRRRRITDAQVKRLREWKPMAQLAREIGISESHARRIQQGYQHKQKSP